jgi:hypothetical protein
MYHYQSVIRLTRQHFRTIHHLFGADSIQYRFFDRQNFWSVRKRQAASRLLSSGSKKTVLVLGKERTTMKVATVTVPSKWEPFKSDVKTCLEFYTSIAATPFQVNVNADGKEGGMEIAEFEKPEDREQNWILEFAINDFNLRTQRNPSQDLGTVVFDFRNELNQQRRVKTDNFRKWLFRGIIKVRDRANSVASESPDRWFLLGTPSTRC